MPETFTARSKMQMSVLLNISTLTYKQNLIKSITLSHKQHYKMFFSFGSSRDSQEATNETQNVQVWQNEPFTLHLSLKPAVNESTINTIINTNKDCMH